MFSEFQNLNDRKEICGNIEWKLLLVKRNWKDLFKRKLPSIWKFSVEIFTSLNGFHLEVWMFSYKMSEALVQFE